MFPGTRSTYTALLLVAAVCTALAASGVADAQTVKGPLPTRDSDPLNTLFLLPIPVDASLLPRNAGVLAANLDVINNFLTTGGNGGRRYVTDFEEQRLTLEYGRGIGDGQQVSIRLPLIDRDGGFLDPIINSFHQAFGFHGGGRSGVPDYRTLFQINNANGQSVVDLTHGTNGIGDLVLEYRRSLTGDGPLPLRRTAVSARALVKLPTGDSHQLFGSGAADFGIGGAATLRPGRRFALHGNVSLVLTGKPSIPNFTPRRSTLVQSMIGAEYLWDNATSLVVQTDDSPAPMRSGISYADRSRRAFTFGIWHQVSPVHRFYISSSENDVGVLAQQAPDFTLSMGFLWHL